MNTGNDFLEPNEEMEARLWAYIDGISEESSLIEKLLAENRAWREKYAELLEVHQLVASVELEQPSLRFTKNVMEEIARYQIAPAAKEYINKKIIWGLAAFFITMIVGFLVYGFSQVNWQDAGSSSSPLGVDLGAVDYSKMFNNSMINGFMMLNVILGLLLLDRYLSARRKKMMNLE
ncbi:MAG: hypothetical protein EON98_15295 [Chitinophagaceae bacterium]|nr:MAG: hypothetical protein EON98_15295 [Chitinophagaceae bacterium]